MVKEDAVLSQPVQLRKQNMPEADDSEEGYGSAKKV